MADMNQIHTFAMKWLDKFRDQGINYIELVDHYMADEIYKSTFDFKAPVVTTSEDSYFISIDTGFVPENENEGYIIDVYKTGEYDSILTNYKLNTLEDDLVLSFEGRDTIASFNVKFFVDTFSGDNV